MKEPFQSMARSILLLLLAAPLCAQDISLHLGLEAGVPLTKPVNNEALASFPPITQQTNERPPFAAGPTVELSVGSQFGVEVDGLYRPVRFQTQQNVPQITIFRSTRASSLELPVLAKYRFNGEKRRASAEVGFIVYDRLWGTTNSRSILHYQGDRETNVIVHYQPPPSGSSPSLVVGAGVEFAAGSFRWGPKLRYTRWIDDPVRKKNQWDLFVGITYQAKRLHRFNSRVRITTVGQPLED